MVKDKKNPLENLTEEQKALGLRIFDLLLAKALRKIYSNLDEKTREDMDKVFSSGSDKEKDDFIKKNIQKFKKNFKEEAKKIEEELKKKIADQILVG